jgi:hypothetical protein
MILETMGGIDGSGPGDFCLPDPSKASQVAIMDMIENVSIGRCMSSTGSYCSGAEAACLDTQTFLPVDPTCRLDDDLLIGSPLMNTIFGKCDDTCKWDDTDCASGTYRPAGSVLGDKCGCEDVMVGACLFGNEYYCAVSADACDFASTFVKHSELPDNVSCRLTEAGLSRKIADKTINPSSTTMPSASFGKSSSGNDKNIGLIVGASVGGVCAVALLTFLIVKFTARCDKPTPTKSIKKHQDNATQGGDEDSNKDTSSVELPRVS